MLAATAALAQSQVPGREVFPPPRDAGAVVVVVSGASGTAYYRDSASRLAALGYFAVLIDGTHLYKRYPPVGFDGAGVLQSVLDDANAAPQAVPGKAALVGFSLGGTGVLVHGAPLSDRVAAVVAYYPAITPLGPDMRALADRLQVPVLLIAGEQDRYADCCLIESMRSLAAAPKSAPFELVTYPSAGHGFNLEETQFAYVSQDAADAWARVTAYLLRLHPPKGPR
ncbi:MAG TPA: dienelactone hydrolase family protein [Burkholderiaceae bacterium]|nr:dienelactone hydrolase family protein [Burkholderiaceae bacterium]